ncbi:MULTISPECIES: LysR family transcriptional regulator ArgP [unclassified Caballeronia]|uniref:LysR family transcriptional regulator ArgP n=1 Tax=unclassified Caballeronia TaxID=2646786 RepID=UPI00285657FE|nr:MULTISPECIES: LysR family transcriptional regulator ArgP [unclassified Caballeronia]MDR5824901.1 LysR family transcriptional regulator ArgP [Caballeronia sp. LZ043]MDR5882781.1 LysR family transcriptional regulator ArgP [Caballeronia sp. LZ032]
MLDYALLNALLAVVRTGSFERAARELSITPSAVSQRVKLLEERVGSLLVRRGQPCEATASGALLCRHTERVQLLEAELGGRMPALPGTSGERRARLRIAVNDDSMSTWFLAAAAEFCVEREVLLDLVVDDQDHTAQRIRDGDVQGAVTTLAEPVPGWRSMKLGRMRYGAVCAPAYFARHFERGLTRDAFRQAPCVNFNDKDELQRRFIRRVTRADIHPPAHVVPHGAGFVSACTAGMAWGMCPRRLVARELESGELVEMSPGVRFDVDLHWQSWRLAVGWLDDFSAVLKRHARLLLD